MRAAVGALLLAAATVARADVASLTAKRDECDAAGDACTAETYVQLSLELGDALIAAPDMSEDRIEGFDVDDFLATASIDSAIEAYESAAKRSFDILGGEHELHLSSLVRLADAFLSKGEYQDAYRRYDGWMQAQDGALPDDESTMAVLAKQGEAVALGRQARAAAASAVTPPAPAARRSHRTLPRRPTVGGRTRWRRRRWSARCSCSRTPTCSTRRGTPGCTC